MPQIIYPENSLTPSGGGGGTIPSVLPFSPKFVIASQIATLDCDRKTGFKIGSTSTLPTDNTAAINNALAGSTAQNPIVVILDGCCSTTSIVGPAGGYWGLWGFPGVGAVYMRPGSNNNAVQNGPLWVPSDPSVNNTPMPARSTRGQYVSIRDLMINGNRAANSNTGDARGGGLSSPQTGYFLFGMDFRNLDHLLVENVQIYEAPTYGIRLVACDYAMIRNVKIVSANRLINTDGLHVSGGCNYGHCENLYAAVGDDPVAFNAEEGYGADINNWTVLNTFYDNCFSLGRCYGCQTTSTPAYNCTGIQFLGGTGTCSTNGFVFGNDGVGAAVQGLPDGLRDIFVDGYSITGPKFASITNSAGVVKLSRISFTPTSAQAAVTYGSSVSSLEFSDFTIYRTTAGNALNWLLQGGGPGAAIESLSIGKFRVVDQSGQSYGSLPYLTWGGASILRYSIGDVDTTKVATLDNGGGFSAAALRGSGVLGTGFQVPDYAVANNTHYVSATSPNAGKICVKNPSGTVIAIG